MAAAAVTSRISTSPLNQLIRSVNTNIVNHSAKKSKNSAQVSPVVNKNDCPKCNLRVTRARTSAGPGCTRCGQWFHFKCIGIKPNSAEANNKIWVCPKCSAKQSSTENSPVRNPPRKSKVISQTEFEVMSITSSDKENHCKCCDKCKERINFLTTRVNCLEQALKELSSLVNTVQCKMDSKANKVSGVTTTTFAAALDKARASTLNGCEIALEPKNVAVTSKLPSTEDSSKSKSSSATRSSVTAGISHQKVSNCVSSNKVRTQGSNSSKNSARISSINYPSSSGRSLTNDSATSSPTSKQAQTRNDPLPLTSDAHPRAEMDNPVGSLSTRRSPPPSSASSQGETRNISPQTYSSQCSISNIERNEHLGNAPKNVRNLHLDLFADNHGWGIGSLVKDSLNVSITEAIKPGMTFNQVIIDIEKSKSNNVVIWAGANDIFRNRAMYFVRSLLELQASSEKIVYLVNIPRRFDLASDHWVNSLIFDTNKTLYELGKIHKNLVVVRADDIKYKYYSTDLLHLNQIGKQIVARRLIKRISMSNQLEGDSINLN
ncbi:unnamed protein product [Bemisia tabaci]|uniref:PHD-type domain-containing protein n=1 Tax=Bemisia tabaci TaxID=7038 RepID=A0A9P0A1W7_BEMTA|nr:unnamed protein product [Bemisia tabaci]